ncbi:hypothetical protein [Lentzea sp. NPDC092896]|uniref:hypothetical protein n=1 Tax=Lentzea sp. NPDC092896 TaxID=3364127 RepID=UPI0038305C23
MSVDPRWTLTSSQGGLSRHGYGIVTGAVLRLIRKLVLDVTQRQLADELGVSIDIVAAWEVGRRPLTNTRAGDFYLHRRTMLRMGADQERLALLDQAVEVDVILAEITEPTTPTVLHPLATSVPDRTITELLAWLLTGRPPRQLWEPGSPTTPLLTFAEQEELALHLRAAADQAPNSEAGAMLRRQTHYLLTHHSGSRDWLHDAAAHERRGRSDLTLWTPDWSLQRSHAVTSSIQGDPTALIRFIEQGLNSDQGIAANLTYWAYWTGELRNGWISDSQMISTSLDAWSGEQLLDSLTDSLADSPYQDLCAHSLWALIQAKPHLIRASATRRAHLITTLDMVLSTRDALTATTRDRLGQVAFFARSAT